MGLLSKLAFVAVAAMFAGGTVVAFTMDRVLGGYRL